MSLDIFSNETSQYDEFWWLINLYLHLGIFSSFNNGSISRRFQSCPEAAERWSEGWFHRSRKKPFCLRLLLLYPLSDALTHKRLQQWLQLLSYLIVKFLLFSSIWSDLIMIMTMTTCGAGPVSKGAQRCCQRLQAVTRKWWGCFSRMGRAQTACQM